MRTTEYDYLATTIPASDHSIIIFCYKTKNLIKEKSYTKC